MSKLILNEKNLLKSGVFKTRAEMVHFLLAYSIASKNLPLGSWVLKSELERHGVNYSTVTVGRFLKEMDFRELTIQSGNQGRILTPIGITWLEDVKEQLMRAAMHDQLSKTIQVKEYGELIELLHTRKVLEREAAYLAAKRASEAEKEELNRAVLLHVECINMNEDPTDSALNFHSIVAKMSHNKFISGLLYMLIYEEKRIESVFDFLVTRERGRIYVQEHQEIVGAIYDMDCERAAALMENHIQELCDAIIEQELERA